MLEDVLSYSRVGGGNQLEYVSLRAAAIEALQDLGIADQNMVEVEDLTVYGGRGQLRSLLQNLLSNAMNYRSPHLDLHIRISGASNYHGSTVFVADNGKGIAPRRQGDSPGATSEAPP